MATTYTATYTGGFGGNSAGANGLSCTLTGDALPSGAEITSISYSIGMSAGGYSSSKKWQIHHFYLGEGSPYAVYKEVSMSNNHETLSGNMIYYAEDKNVFDGSVTLYAKVNTTHSSTSYMHDVEIIITYKVGGEGSDVSLSSSSVDAGKSITVTMANDNLSSVYHKLTFSLGDESKSATTSTGIGTYSFTIP